MVSKRFECARTKSLWALAAVFAMANVVEAQNPAPPIAAAEASLGLQHELAALPDAPGFGRAASTTSGGGAAPASSSASTALDQSPAPSAIGAGPSRVEPAASRFEIVIEPGQVAPSLTAGDKVLLGLKDSVSPFSMIGWVATAGYEHLTNSSPEYGTDRGAFGERLGAAAVRDSTDNILGESLMSPVFHEDPRYYRMGQSHNFFVRVAYSGTRPLLSRTDSGKLTVNFANLTGTLEGSAATNLYYPPVNRGFGQTLETFGGSIAGDAIADLVSEFYRDFTEIFRLEKR